MHNFGEMKNQLACVAALLLGKTRWWLTLKFLFIIRQLTRPHPWPGDLHDHAPGADAVPRGQLHQLGRVQEPGPGDGLPPGARRLRRHPLLLLHHRGCPKRYVGISLKRVKCRFLKMDPWTTNSLFNWPSDFRIPPFLTEMWSWSVSLALIREYSVSISGVLILD